MSLIKWVLVLASLGLSAPAAATNWQAEISNDALATHVPGVGAGVLVAPAGEHAAELSSVLLAALAEIDGITIAMDSGAIGDTTAMSDGEIVAGAKAFPITQIWVARVFPGSKGDTAIVTMYDQEGEVLGALNVVEATPLEPRAASVGQGMNAAAQGAVADVAKDAGQVAAERRVSREEAIRAVEDRVVWFEDWMAVTSSGYVVDRWSVPKAGRFGRSLGGAEFYEYIGEPELAEEYRTRGRRKGTVVLLSLVATGAGAGLYYLGGQTCDYCDSELQPLEIGGLVLGSAGLAIFAGSAYYWDPNPVMVDARKRLANEFNEALVRDYQPENLSSRGVEFGGGLWTGANGATGIEVNGRW